MDIKVNDISGIFPRPLMPEEERRVENLVGAALLLIEEHFLRAGRDFYSDLVGNRLLELTTRRVVREMISEAIHIGENVGRQSASSTTGPQSDSFTYSQGVGIHWGSVFMTDQWLKDLGLGGRSVVGFSFPQPKQYADPVAYRGSSEGPEFAERGR